MNVTLNTTTCQKMNEFENNVVFCENVGLMYVPRRCKWIASLKLRVEVNLEISFISRYASS